VLTEDPGSKLALPDAVLKLEEEARPLNKLVLVILGGDLDNLAIILIVAEVSAIEVHILEGAVERVLVVSLLPRIVDLLF